MDDEQLELFGIKKVLGLKDYKVCQKCTQEKHVSCFTFREPKVGKAYRTECKECQSKKQALRTQLIKENPRPTEAEYICPICKKTEEQLKFNGQFHDRSVWVLDHNHTNHRFRAWICNNCNMGLGKFNDSEATVEEALKYLKKEYEK